MTTHEVIIIGAGFGGLGAAIALQRLGIDDVVILEREDDLGGTWHVNRYPGLAVDIASMTYSYSFEPNPYWSRLYAPGAELKRYADHVADRYDLRRHLRLGTAVERAQWDARWKRWTLTLADGSTLRTRTLVTATGFLSQPKLPDIEGIDSFAGKVVHTADWDESWNYANQRIAVIGTGATAVQLVPELAREAAELTVYQRTPIWVVPKFDAPVPGIVQQFFARVPASQRAARLANTGLLELLMVSAVLHFRQVGALNRTAARVAKLHLRAQVPDADLRRKLTPDYDFGCKRPTFSNDYYRAFTRPHVTLETDPIVRVEPDGIVTASGHKAQVDALVCATGFDLWQTNFPAIEVVGRGGCNLGDWWREHRFQAYQGVAVPGFPNFLSLSSPYSYSGLSYFTTIETQMRHIERLFGELHRRGADVFEVTEQANAAFLDRVTDLLDDSVFTRGACSTSRSYYFDPHGEASILRPTSTRNAIREAGSFPLDDYAYA